MSFRLRGETFEHNGLIPARHAQDGENLSPPLRWHDAPEQTREFALICDDPDAPRDEPWVHWVIYRIAADCVHLPEGIARGSILEVPAGVYQGPNTGGQIGYDGPAPPRGHGPHRYYFKLYALDAQLKIGPGANKEKLLDAIREHVLGQTQIVGIYER